MHSTVAADKSFFFIAVNNISGSRTPTLQTPIPKTARAGRAFYYSAPRMWNCLPCDIKQSASINVFKNRLKISSIIPKFFKSCAVNFKDSAANFTLEESLHNIEAHPSGDITE